ncbi:oligosaccharyl transferase glycoprotein complex, beta subunit [Saitoella coloradoensis]
MRFLQIAAAVLCAAAGLVSAKSATGDRLLAVVDAGTDRADYSQFFDGLTDRHFDITFSDLKDADLSLFKLDERTYDHLILFPSRSKGLGPNLAPLKLLEFVNAGGNVLIATNPSSVPEQLRDFARELGVEMAERDAALVDHWSYDASSDESHGLITANGFTGNEYILSEEVRNGPPVLYSGSAHALSNSPLVVPVLSAGRTAYVYDTKEEQAASEDPWVSGTQAHLVSVLQARNNARVAVVGSMSIFSNEFIDRKEYGNAKFVRDLSGWVFAERGVVKVVRVRHHLMNETAHATNPSTYRVKNDITYAIELSEWSVDHWQPYIAEDVQLEVIMLDPYIRTKLPLLLTTPTTSVYEKSFMLPDHYGNFHFKVNYKRPGVTYIEERESITIRHFRHDEYPRFISAAWPYYGAAAAVSLGFLGVCILWMGMGEETLSEGKKRD